MISKKLAVNSKKFVILLITVVIAIGISLFLVSGGEKEEFQLIPETKAAGTGGSRATGTEVGTGWSTREDPTEAVREAADMALDGKEDKTPDLAIIFASSGSDLRAILSESRQVFGDETKIYGGTSDSRAVITDKGFVKATDRAYESARMEGKRGLAIMTITSEDMVFGVGSGNMAAYASVQLAARTAVLDAIESAGKPQNEMPRIILVTPTIAIEEEVIEGIESIVGESAIILGGTAGGPTLGVFGDNEVYDEGVSLVVIYTDLPVGWTFEGGFDATAPQTGIVTRVEGQAIIEIDNRPALDVYDEWLGGEIKRLQDEIGKADVIRDLLTLHPIYRRYTSPDGQVHFLFSHPWPRDETLEDRAIMTSTKIKVGERIYLSHGTWETLLNRIGNLPVNAKVYGGIDVATRPLLGIGYICGGVMGTIPEIERKKMPALINYANNEAPFIASFTWGEQGCFPGIGNKHGNLLTAFIVIGEKR